MSTFKDNFTSSEAAAFPYLSKDIEAFCGTLTRMPERSEVPIEINEILIVEYYSK